MARALINLVEHAQVKSAAITDALRATLLPRHPLQIDVLKAIACACMLGDHINTCLFDRASVLAYLVGRLAFPLFGLAFALTLNPVKALQTARRLAIAGALTQPIYALAFQNTGFSPWWAGNILFSFAAVAYLVEQAKNPTPAAIASSLTVIAAVALIQSPSSFGLAGIAWLYALHRFLNPKPDSTAAWPAAALVAFFMLNPGMPIANALIAAAIAAIIAASQYARSSAPRRTTRAPWSLAFYAGHLLAIVLILAAQHLARSTELATAIAA
ncbi:conjugal transfer protein TraX [Methyloversatilis sp. XJ19-49]|uniref:conjugal transfer protein TraX n=1 Tax=Methyloversatilis sp. XJ19-49 TaxID=2963429 RepID=UPI00211CC117|nr:conjugal transfer protein TraX [Methyloversatilis sp. XJ19-49]MCQ9378322.1 conjugal transfer protein TraX [Methyloversatilis sp. XJ19-49]